MVECPRCGSRRVHVLQGMTMKSVGKSEQYVIASRRIAGTHAEKMEQIDEAIQELLDIKLLESADDRPNVQFLAVPRRSHWFGMTMAIVVMLVLLALLLGVRPAHAQDAGNPPQAPTVDSGKPADPPPAMLAGLVWWIGNKTGSW